MPAPPEFPDAMGRYTTYLRSLSPSRRRSLVVVLTSLIILRSRIFTAPKDVWAKLNAVARGSKLTPEDLNNVLQQLYITEADGSRTLLVPYRNEYLAKVPFRPIPPSKFKSDAPYFPLLSETSKSKPNIDAAFFKQLKAILFRITLPSWRSRELLILAFHTFFLVLRTVLSVAVARLDGRIVRDLVSANAKGFVKGLGLWFLLAIPSTYTNSMIRYLQSKLAFRLRTRLTRYAHDLYLSSSPNLRYYRTGLEGVDQYITADIEAFSESLAGLYGNIAKPSLDLLLFTSQLSRSLGVRGTILLFANYYATVSILRAVTPAFGRLAAVEARLEGEYRAGMGRVGRESEEIAFYDGGGRERDILTRAYLRLIKHVNSIYKIRIAYEWTEDYVIKYLWSAAGYGLIAVPLLFTRTRRSLGVQAGDSDRLARHVVDDAVADRTETYVSNRRLLLSLADAGGRLMFAYKDLLELAGLTTRLYVLLSTLHNVKPLPLHAGGEDDPIELSHVDIAIPQNGHSDASGYLGDDDSLSGSEERGSSRPLVKDLSFVLREGEHLMITGSNGVGKTAVARVLAGLWAPQGVRAKMGRPGSTSQKSIFVIPQRAYMVTGSLLDQMIYPHSYPEFLQSGTTLEDMMEILRKVHLEYLPEREGGWRTRKEWRDVLSGGEKQRMAMARVFYHRPKYAVLDECTSAVSSDVEGRMYEHAKELGITLITISIRPSLTKYHTRLLTLSGDGSGTWTLSRVGTAEERMSVEREILSLEKKLAEVEEWEKKVQELNMLLASTE